MGWFSDAVDSGVSTGVALGAENAWADGCDGYWETDERCPIPASRGHCICQHVRQRREYAAASWWRRLLLPKPSPPADFGHTLSLLTERAIRDDGFVDSSPVTK